MKKFEEYLEKGDIRKISPNKNRALALIEESEKKKKFLEITIKSISEQDMNPNFIVDSCYNIIIELIRAKMLIEGYYANSHEVEIAYMEKLGFNYTDIKTMDELRYYRNGIKYYGKILNKEYADKILKFMERMVEKLRKILN